MDYYYELDDDFDESGSSRGILNLLHNKKFMIIAAIIIFVVILFGIIIFGITHSQTGSKYDQIKKEMVEKAKEYMNENASTSIAKEIYLDVSTIGYDISNNCSIISGVFYDGRDYTPYLKCDEYESKIINNEDETITLNGDNIIFLAKGIPFYDPWYKSNNKVTVTGQVETNEGVYVLHYYSEGSSSYLTRKVVVINNEDLQRDFPAIELNGEEVTYVKMGEKYIDKGAIANDTIDGDISDRIEVINPVDTDILGEQIVTYIIVDSQGYKNTITRTVNVINVDVSMYSDYVIKPTYKVNDNVTINLNIYGEDYDYTILPNNEKTTENIISYKVTENGTYTFSMYDKFGKVEIKDIEVNNIDKDPPSAVCEAVKYSGYTNITVTQKIDDPISLYEYQVNGTTMMKSFLSSYRANSSSVTSVSVILEDNAGNTNKINCEVIPYLNWKTDYSRSKVYLKNIDDNNVIKEYGLDDYLKGVFHLTFNDLDYSKYSDSQLLELFKTFFVVEKAELLSTGKYSIYSRQLIFQIDKTEFCDVYNGCKLVSKGGKKFYIGNNVDFKSDEDFNSGYDKLDNHIIELMDKAYDATKKEVTTNNDFNDVLITFTSSYTHITSSIKESILSNILNGYGYREVIAKLMPNYKIYNIDNYSSKFNEITTNSKYYWPIGSAYANQYGFFSGAPESTELVYDYGVSLVDNKVHYGIGIRGECGKTKVIASKDGKVISVGSNSEYGYHVIIQHDNGVNFVYGSLMQNTIAVSVGSIVKKGQLIGYVGSTDNTCMLYVETRNNGTVVNPIEYISVDNLRPVSGEKIIYVEGGTVKKSVCLTLLASGFSVDATAALMANIERESNFSLTLTGDNGTSVGLCQWHSGRWDKLSNYCGSRIYTTECQLSYLLYELMNNYKSTYTYLLSNHSAYDMAYEFCYYFEIPKARDTSCYKRGDNAKNNYVQYVLNNCN